MIYSQDINKICSVCQQAHKYSDEEMYCDEKKQPVPVNGEGCDKFSYDILKRRVQRMRRIKTDYRAEDFTL